MTAAAGPNRRPRRRVWFPEIADPGVEVARGARRSAFRGSSALRRTFPRRSDRLSDARRLCGHLSRRCGVFVRSAARPARVPRHRATSAAVRRFWAFLDDRHPTFAASGGSDARHMSMTSRSGCATAGTRRSPPINHGQGDRVPARHARGAAGRDHRRACSTRLRHVASRYYGKGAPARRLQRPCYGGRCARLRAARCWPFISASPSPARPSCRMVRPRAMPRRAPPIGMVMDRLVLDGTIGFEPSRLPLPLLAPPRRRHRQRYADR